MKQFLVEVKNGCGRWDAWTVIATFQTQKLAELAAHEYRNRATSGVSVIGKYGIRVRTEVVL